MRLLNIGAGPKEIPVLPWYKGWDVVRLDIETEAEPDLLMDAMELDTLSAGQFDAVYGSHLLEHIYIFNLSRFLGGVQHVLTPDGFAEFRVPNALEACKAAAKVGRLDAFCYNSPGGRITAWDMLYGYGPFQERWGEPMAHHNAFDTGRLADTLNQYGFPRVYVQGVKWELRAVACKTDLPDTMKQRMNIDQKGTE
jgi:predicted SAM-dependent methyltransferase